MAQLKYHSLIYANNTYYILNGGPRSVIEWILTAYGVIIVTIQTDKPAQADKVLQLIALIHFLENLQKLQENTYLSQTKH